jgi:chemotaxis protein CheX
MDEAVAEVFESMIARSCAAVPDLATIRTDISARITISGSLIAQCAAEFPLSSAERLTSALLGSAEAGWDDALVADAVGEFCNMIAGGWKRRMGVPICSSDLSVPSVTRVPDSETPQPGTERMRRVYRFDDSPFVVRLSEL